MFRGTENKLSSFQFSKIVYDSRVTCKSKPLLLSLLFLIFSRAFDMSAGTHELSTLAEQTQWKKTGRYDEVIRLCDAFRKAFPGKVRTSQFGTTPEGRPMLALVASQDGTLTPKQARARRRPVVYFQGGIHAGEIDGKDAGFWFLRDLLQGKILAGALSKVTIVFVPVFNIDGHERFGAHNRPNQVGPEEMGWRTTAQNLNLNRDFAKAEAPEMQALLGLFTAWDPILSADLHVTDGAKFQHDIAVMIDPTLAGPVELRAAGMKLEKQVMSQLASAGHLPLPYYPAFEKTDDPASGFGLGTSDIKFSHAYWAARNRIGVLVETHSWHNYGERVKATRETLIALVGAAARDGADWLKKTRAADQEMSRLAGKRVTLAFGHTDKFRTIDFLGYEYRRTHSEVSGSTRIAYDDRKPQVWKLPLFEELKPRVEVIAPLGGYVVPAAHVGWVVPKLKLHGIRHQVIARAIESDMEVFRADSFEFGKEPFESRTTLALRGNWALESRKIPPHSIYIPVSQPLARLVLALFEPTSPDSFASWGFFNGNFEKKEYLESYVAEETAEKMLQNPKVKKEFQNRLDADPEFAKSPEKRLEFFHRKHPSWDDHFALYPITRLRAGPPK